MSGGVDSAVAGLLCAARRDDGRGHARAVGGRRERRRAQLLLGFRGLASPRARPLDGPAALHDRPARGVPRRRGRAVHRRLRGRARRRTRAWAATVTCASTRCSSSPTGSAARRWPPATTRASPSPRRRGPLLRVAADPAKDQTYMLAALSPRSLARMRFPLGELTKPEVREIAAYAGLPVASKADSQDLCFLAGTDRGGSSPATASSATAPARSSTAAAAYWPPPRPAPVHGRPAPWPRRRRRRAAVRLAKDAGRTRPGRARARRCAATRCGCEELGCTATAARVDRVKLRYRSAPIPARSRGAGRRAVADSGARRAGRRGRAGTGRVPDGRRDRGRVGDDCAPGRRAVVHVAAAPTLRGPMTTDEIRKTFTGFFVARDHLRLPSSSLIPAEHDPRRCSRSRGCTR